MNIDKTDFVNALAESGSTITIGVTPAKCFFVLLQSDKDLPDVHLKSGDAIAYVDPATTGTIGDSVTYQGRDFTLMSQVKVKYIGDNQIYRLLGFQLSSRLPPYLLIASIYSYEEISTENVYASFFLPSVYSYEEISSENVYAAFFLPASYTIASELFALSIFSSYSYEEISSVNVSASFFLPSVYSYEEISSENVSAGFFLPASYTISSELFSLSIFSSYSYEEISSENVSAAFFLPSVYSYEEISSENVSAAFFLPSVYSYEEISSENVSASFFLPSVYSYLPIGAIVDEDGEPHYPTVTFDAVPLVNPQMQDMYYRVLTGDVALLSGKQSVQSSTEIALTVKFICSTFTHADVINLRAKIGTKATLDIDGDTFSCYINAKAFIERRSWEKGTPKYEYEVEFIEHTA